MELNASDERGISVVRNKIKTFASSAIGKADPEYPCPPYKLLILDEADSMTQVCFALCACCSGSAADHACSPAQQPGHTCTLRGVRKMRNVRGAAACMGGVLPCGGECRIETRSKLPLQDAQNALRRIMETHSNVTRFCFICNYVSRIIEPLASRCAKFRFKPLHEGIMTARINSICASEGVELADGALARLGHVSHGDLRRAITTLQSAFTLAGNPVRPETLVDVSGEVRAVI